jgi:hypothetical protein
VVAVTRRRVTLGERGRLPFALVGVLLVVTSALFAAGVGRRTPPPEPAVDLAMERTTADSRATLRQAVAAAGVAAASNPVTNPANTSYGAVLSEDETFEDALAVRTYLAARRRLASVGRTHRGVRTNVSLPGVDSPAELARARDRVTVERAGPHDAQLDVRLAGVRQTARDGQRVVGRRNVTLTVRVDSPVLAVHDRVEKFQERLDNGVTDPGLSQRLTARLYAVAWARGYAQYGGAPIDNVVANRHIEPLTNGALLAVQRSVFGESDPDGRRALSLAMGALVLNELTNVAGSDYPAVSKLVRERIARANAPSEHVGVPSLGSDATGAPPPNETTNVSVGETARHAFAPYVRPPKPVGERNGSALATFGTGSWLRSLQYDDTRGLNATIQSVFSATVRTVGARRHVGGGDPPAPPRPRNGTNWTLVNDTTSTSVERVTNASDAPAVSVPADHHRLRTFRRTVRLDHERTRYWRRNGTFTVTTTGRDEVYDVTVAVVGRHAQTPYAPDYSVATVHERAGPFDGPNLADVGPAVDEAVDARGGPGSLAAATARGDLDANATTIRGAWPAELRAWAYADLVDLRETVREISVAVERGRVGTFQTNPPAKLAAAVRERRAALLDAGGGYDHVADKARVALRGRFLDRVVAILEARARLRETREDDLSSALSEHSPGSLSALRDSLAARRLDDRDDAGALSFTVDGAPPYLTRTGITDEDVSAVPDGKTVHSLVAKNVNAVTIPYADATDTVLNGLGALGSEGRTRLRTGALALQSAESAEAATGRTFGENRTELRSALNDSFVAAYNGIHVTLQAHGVDTDDAHEITRRAFARWETRREQVLAVSDRRIVGAVLAEAKSHPSTDLSTMERDRLRLDLRDRLTRELDTERLNVPAPLVTATTERVRSAVGDAIESELKEQFAKRFNHSINRIPAGFPLAPMPGSWYATMNVWWVTVEGRYERFAVEAPRRTPAAADASLSYVRDGSSVTLDVDGDGNGELLGSAPRIDFRSEVGIVVVVPAGGAGVGDINGDIHEITKGWPDPGPASLDTANDTRAGGDGGGNATSRVRRSRSVVK